MRAYATPPCAGCADAHDFGAVRIFRIQFRMASPGHELLIHELLNVINASSALNSMLRTLIARSSAPILLFSAIDPQARPSWKPCILSTQASCCTAHAIMLHRTITTAAPSPPYLGAVDDPRRRPIFRSGTKWPLSARVSLRAGSETSPKKWPINPQWRNR